jgi:hypothetical protein
VRGSKTSRKEDCLKKMMSYTEDLLKCPTIGEIDDCSVVSLESIEDLNLQQQQEDLYNFLLSDEDEGLMQEVEQLKDLSLDSNNLSSGEESSSSYSDSDCFDFDIQLIQSQTVTKQNDNTCASSSSWGEWDVPLGRQQKVREFIGNIRFRQLVEEHRPAYKKASRKSEKTRIALQVFSIIYGHGGRFLDNKQSKQNKSDRNQEEETWYEIHQDKALSKISQALRKGTRPVRREQSLKSMKATASMTTATTTTAAFQQPMTLHDFVREQRREKLLEPTSATAFTTTTTKPRFSSHLPRHFPRGQRGETNMSTFVRPLPTMPTPLQNSSADLPAVDPLLPLLDSTWLLMS